MKKIFFTLTFILVTSFAFANNIETDIIEDNVVSLNEMSNTELLKENLELNESSYYTVSLKCWAAKQWVKMKCREVSDNDELIDEIGDAVYELCELARDLGLI